MLTIGLDAEPDEPRPDGVLGVVAIDEERRRLERLAAEHLDVRWDRLLFSAKESVYKAWFPLTRQWLGFEDAVIGFDREAGTFEARLLRVAQLPDGAPIVGFTGRWLARDGLLLTAVAVARPRR
jgi:4'-phosphopantetheinyl transferase EntD